MEPKQTRSERERHQKRHKRNNILLIMTAALIVVACGVSIYLFMSGTLNLNSTAAEKVVKGSSDDSAVCEMSAATLESSSATPEQSTPPTDTLKAGTNHSQQAAAYSYHTKDIRKAIYAPEEYTGDKICFLTFDDGVNYEVTPKILDILKQHDVPATFFVVGKTLSEETKPLLDREIKEGHAIGIHSYSHDYQLLYPNGTANVEQIEHEVTKTQSLLQSLLGEEFKSMVWRYPGGHMSWKGTADVDAVLRKSQLEWMDWNTTVGDAEPASARPKTVEDMLAYHKHTLGLEPHSSVRVVLMHDAVDKQLTIDSLPYIIEYYKSQGYKFGVLT